MLQEYMTKKKKGTSRILIKKPLQKTYGKTNKLQNTKLRTLIDSIREIIFATKIPKNSISLPINYLVCYPLETKIKVTARKNSLRMN